MNIPIYWIAICAGLVQIFGYVDYLIQSKREHGAPNPAGWGMWAFGAATHLWAYSQVTVGWEQDLLPAVCSATCLAVFIHLWVSGKFRRNREKITSWEKFVFATDLAITALFGGNLFSASAAAVLLQTDDLLTYLPTIRDTSKNPRCEHFRPWAFWATGYALQGWVVASSGGGWVEWSYPLINLPLCLIILALSLRNNRCSV